MEEKKTEGRCRFSGCARFVLGGRKEVELANLWYRDQ